MDDSEIDLSKLINQLSKRVPGLELDPDVVKQQVNSFKIAESEILKKIGVPNKNLEKRDVADENSVAKLVEEMKALPSRVAERLGDTDDRFFRRRRTRRFSPMLLQETLHMAAGLDEPFGLLLFASLVRDDAPWVYEMAMEAYRAIKSGKPAVIKDEIVRCEHLLEMVFRGPFFEEFSGGDKEVYMMVREFPHILHHMLDRAQNAKPTTRRTPLRTTGGPASQARP